MQFTITTLVLATSALMSGVTAQYYPTYNPNNTALAVRNLWCVQQEASCDLLCLDQQSGGQYNNGCDPESLAYSCVCSDGTIPNATQYSQTIPYFICQEEVVGCTTACNSVSSCVTACNDNKHCGASDPVRPNSSTITTQLSTSTTSASPTATGDVIYTGFGTGGAAAPTSQASSSSTTSSGGAAAQTSQAGLGLTSGAMGLGQVYGATIFMLTAVCSTFVFLL